MRRLGTLPTEREAQTFRDYLYLQQIEADVEGEDDGSFAIWVHDDVHLPAAGALLERYRGNPDAAEFSKVSGDANRVRSDQEREDARKRSTIADRARIQYEQTFMGMSWLPLILIGICVAVAFYSNFGKTLEVLNYFTFKGVDDPENPRKLVGIADGQIWRVITPIFIHFGFLHLIFNCMWLRTLGTFIESRFGSLYLMLLVVVIGIGSNVAQDYMTGPNPREMFGGMSGVNYGLFGFLWIRGKYDRGMGWEVHPEIVSTMLIWYVLCFTGLLGHIANTAHTVGLLMGMAWGFLSSGRVRLK